MSSWRFTLARHVRQRWRYGSPVSNHNTVPVIRTVLVEPDLNRVCLVFVGQLKVAVPLSPARAETIQHHPGAERDNRRQSGRCGSVGARAGILNRNSGAEPEGIGCAPNS